MASLNVATGSRMDRLLSVPRKARQARLPWIALTVVVILLVCAVFAPLLSPHDPTKISILDAKLAPGQNMTFPLGTDILGQDILSRMIYGARTAVLISLIALGTGPWWALRWAWLPVTAPDGRIY